MLYVYLAGPILPDDQPDWRASFRRHMNTAILESDAKGSPEDLVTLIEPGAAIPDSLTGPRDAQLAFEVYGPADRISLDLADIIVAFLPDVNSPEMGASYGLGTSAEMGYAKAMNKVILGILSGADQQAIYHWRFLLGFTGLTSAPSIQKAAHMVALWAFQAAGETRRGK